MMSNPFEKRHERRQSIGNALFLGFLCYSLLLALAPATCAAAASETEEDFSQAELAPSAEELAVHFFPYRVWYHRNETCSWPAEEENPGVAVYRVRTHPRDPDFLAVTFSILYRNDCGGIFELDSHPGDVESFTYTLMPDQTCEMGWRLFSVKTTAHAGTPGDVGEEVLNTCGPLSEIFVSYRKHGTYLSIEQCNENIDPTQRCGRGFAADFELVNAGDPEAPLADDLSAYFPSDPGNPGEYIWTGDGRFCGGQYVEDRLQCVNSPGSKLTNDGLLAPSREMSSLYEFGSDWESGSYATSVAFGDIDGDSLKEIGITRKTESGARFFILDDAAHSFKILFESGAEWGSGSSAVSMAFGDVDGDGIDEVGVARSSTAGYRFVVLDDALSGFNQLFSGGEDWSPASYATAIAFGDVDGDGLAEIAVAKQSIIGDRYFIFDDAAHQFKELHAGGRGWELFSSPTSLAFGDVDGDSMDELAVTRKTAKGARLFVVDDEAAGFAEMFSFGEMWQLGRYATSVAFGDVDGDGRDELGLGRLAQTFANNREERYWVLDDALHSFQELTAGGGGEPTTTTAKYQFQIAFGDVDGNGRSETGIGRSATVNSRYWLLDDAELGFHSLLVGSGGRDWDEDSFVTGIAFGDVDGDGRDELGIIRQSKTGMRMQVLKVTYPEATEQPGTILIGLGDSLSHGTLDATNNWINTSNAYLQKVADPLSEVMDLYFSQPFFSVEEERLEPFEIPTNLAVDGAEVFTLEGLHYYKRVGAEESYLGSDLLADRLLPAGLKDKYDKVLYPLNLYAKQSLSQLDGAIWLLNEGAPRARIENALMLLWIGNNDSSLAALGGGGSNPQFQPLPFDLLKNELKPALRLLLAFGEQQGAVSFEPYTQSAIERNLTEAADFAAQYERLVSRLLTETENSPVAKDLVLITLPYYSAVGYLIDSDDLEFYLRKIDPGYTVPPTFKRVAEPGQPITDYLAGDRVSLLTFGMMYSMLATGFSTDEVNKVLETDGQQRDGLVLSEAEQQFIMARIDTFNAAINQVAAAYGPRVHLIDVGAYLNAAFTGGISIELNGKTFNRKWVRGSGFCLDGVHPGYTGHALIANVILEKLNEMFNLQAAPHDLSSLMLQDPYIDWDNDGWSKGPDYAANGMTKLLFLFKDPDDTDPTVQVEIPDGVWDLISDELLSEILGIPIISQEADRLGIDAPQ
ncbi:MAG: hypothetical protein KQH63_06295 [Desulfobulbaceae bacterium]|nr:hypothetical protein [Desulfobulbaceae bacterium]